MTSSIEPQSLQATQPPLLLTPASILDDLDKRLPPLYACKLQQIKEVNGITDLQAIALLIDLYTVESHKEIKLITNQISRRLDKGIDAPFLFKLKYLYTFLGHFLRKINYIK